MGRYRLLKGSTVCLLCNWGQAPFAHFAKTCKRGLTPIARLIILIKESDALHAAKELTQQVTLIGAVYGIALQSESHKQRIQAQHLLELGQYWYTAAATARNGLYAVNFTYGL